MGALEEVAKGFRCLLTDRALINLTIEAFILRVRVP
jgi:hypothetical protein